MTEVAIIVIAFVVILFIAFIVAIVRDTRRKK